MDESNNIERPDDFKRLHEAFSSLVDWMNTYQGRISPPEMICIFRSVWMTLCELAPGFADDFIAEEINLTKSAIDLIRESREKQCKSTS